MLDRAWQVKKSLETTISNPEIDDFYERALRAAWEEIARRRQRRVPAFLLRTAPPRHLRRTLTDLKSVPFRWSRKEARSFLSGAIAGEASVHFSRPGWVINVKPPEGKYVCRWGEFQFLPGITDWIRLANAFGYLVIVVTNHGGAARGSLSSQELDAIHSRMVAELLAGHALMASLSARTRRKPATAANRGREW